VSTATPNPIRTLIDGERRNRSFLARSHSPGRLYVLVAATRLETDALQHAWIGQAVDVQPCPNLAAALVLIGRLSPQSVVVGDWTGPLGPVNFVESLREIDTEVPVIVGIDDAQTSLGSDLLAAGATAIVRRPFAPAKVLRILHACQDVPFEIRPLPIDLGRLRVDGVSPRIWLDGVESTLPAMEYLLLRYLAERHGEILPRRELLEAAWGEGATRSSNSLAVHMHRLRGRLEGDGGQWIRPIRNIGYQFLVPPRRPGTSKPGPRSMRRHEL
jgi:DNA-binding response OmpR family regulator